MNLHSAIAVLGLASVASADLSYTFEFTDFFVEDTGLISNVVVFSDPTSEYVGETLISVEWDLSFESDNGGLMDALVYLDGQVNNWFPANTIAGYDALVVSNDGSTTSFAGSWDASFLNIVLDGSPILMGAGVGYYSDLGEGTGILNGSITYNMTPAPGALVLLGMAGVGRRKRS